MLFLFGVITFIMTGARCEKPEVLVEVGSQAILPCKSSDISRVSPAIVWTKGDTSTVWRKTRSGLQSWGSKWSNKGNLRVRCPHSQFERGDYSLEINNVSEEDAGLYTCKVEHRGQVTVTDVMLRIIKVSISPPFPVWGNNILVTCNILPRPRDASVQWMLNNSPFVPRSAMATDKAESVVTEKATMKLSGNWTCVIGYEGKEGRASATLSVGGIVQPPKENTKLYAAVGSAVTLPCVFSSGLIPLSATWEKVKADSFSKSALDHLPPSFSQNPAQSSSDKSARLNDVGFEDEGEYRCSGTVEGQRLTQNMHLVVAKIVQSQKKNSVALTCELSDASEVTEYEWVHVIYDLNNTQSISDVRKGKTLSIKGSEENFGEWTCRFSGKEGILGNVTHHLQLMSGLSGKVTSSVSKNTGVIVALSFLLIVLLLVLVQVYKNHQRRKRIFQYPALETIVHTISNEREERERSRVKK
ncbi:lymphocyte activation gene 3 protein-like [Mugil cephalus]|uniref:lymphocyte activation gene 3 protein-like n=1 Tax=Mugil cephalus TaxID=48193 RepID=UPI001FB711DB|nr:lymphocyte activation gene 3 protein-like [Mugil cephalus]